MVYFLVYGVYIRKLFYGKRWQEVLHWGFLAVPILFRSDKRSNLILEALIYWSLAEIFGPTCWFLYLLSERNWFRGSMWYHWMRLIKTVACCEGGIATITLDWELLVYVVFSSFSKSLALPLPNWSFCGPILFFSVVFVPFLAILPENWKNFKKYDRLRKSRPNRPYFVALIEQ